MLGEISKQQLGTDIYEAINAHRVLKCKKTTLISTQNGQRIFNLPVDIMYDSLDIPIVTFNTTFLPEEKYTLTETQLIINDEEGLPLDSIIRIMFLSIENSKLLEYKDEIASKLMKEVDLLKKYVDNKKTQLETAIIDNLNIEVSNKNPQSDLPDFDSLIEAIESHVCREEGKQELLDMMIRKLPALSTKLNINSSLKEFAYYLNMIGEMFFSIVEQLDPLVLEQISISILENIDIVPFEAILSNSFTEKQSNNSTLVELIDKIKLDNIENTDIGSIMINHFNDNISVEQKEVN